MSNRLLEDAQERRHAETVASAIKISVADLSKLEWEIERHESDDGVLYGYNLYFREGSDPDVLSKIPGLIHGSWLRLGPNAIAAPEDGDDGDA